MKVFMLVDMEGITGVCLEDHTSAGTPAYEQARRWMTEDVNAAVQGALDGGADEVLALDGHGANHFYNLVYEDLHPGARYVLGRPRPWYITGLDETFDCMLMVGMHAMSGTPAAVLEHTWSSAQWHKCRLNGRETGEIGLMAAYAGSFGVPVTLVTGDRAACAEAAEFISPDIAFTCVKEGLGRYSANMMVASPARQLIRQAAAKAVSLAGATSPVRIEGPCAIEVDYIRNAHTDAIRPGPGAEAVGPRTFRYTGQDIREACQLMR